MRLISRKKKSKINVKMTSITNRRNYSPYAPFVYQAGKIMYPSLPPAGSVYKKYKGSYKRPIGPKNRTYLGKKGYKKVGGKTLKKKVQALTKMVNADNATHTHRYSATGKVLANYSQTGITSVDANTSALIETAVASLRYYDPSNPTVLTSAVGASGTYSRKFGIHNMHSKIVIRNNYRIPVKIKVMLVTPKVDTSITPETAFTTGLTKQLSPSATSTLVHFSDSDMFRELWSVVKSKSFELKNNKECSLSHSTSAFEYDPSLYDSHSLLYQKTAKACRWLIRIEGVLAHDSVVTTEQGLANCGVDFAVESKWVIKYDAGTNLNDVSLSDGYDTFTTQANVGVDYSPNATFTL